VPDFFEAVKRGLERGVATVSVKSKEMLETTQLRSQVKALQEDRQRGLTELGNIVYTLHLQGKLDAEVELVRGRCEALATLDQKIRDKEDEIRRIQLQAQKALGAVAASPLAACDCGAPVYDGVKFCGGCGKNVEDVLRRVQVGTKCSHCGAPLARDGRFCGGCGARATAETA
jgi:NADH pyrophosphatase NudC (nudix superfamily)